MAALLRRDFEVPPTVLVANSQLLATEASLAKLRELGSDKPKILRHLSAWLKDSRQVLDGSKDVTLSRALAKQLLETAAVLRIDVQREAGLDFLMADKRHTIRRAQALSMIAVIDKKVRERLPAPPRAAEPADDTAERLLRFEGWVLQRKRPATHLKGLMKGPDADISG